MLLPQGFWIYSPKYHFHCFYWWKEFKFLLQSLFHQDSSYDITINNINFSEVAAMQVHSMRSHYIKKWTLNLTQPHKISETPNSCVGLYILGGPIAGDTIGPTQTLVRIGSARLWYHIKKWTLSLIQKSYKTGS